MLALGQDPKINYVRKTEEFWIDDASFDRSFEGESIIDRKREQVWFDPELIGFCGEIVPLVKIGPCYDGKPKRLYDIQSIQKIMGEGKIPDAVVEWITDLRLSRGWVAYSWKKKRFIDVFKDYKVPVFHAESEGDGTKIVINPCLKTLEFFRKYPDFEAWQKLSHYVGNVLLEESKPVWPIPDKVTAQSHGFDKYSFRKDKQKSE
jgi:hypothetical protein